jgi:hypothetical protein
MSGRLCLGSLPEPAASKRSGRLATERIPNEAASEVPLDQMRENDQIVIQTSHSAYIFLVIDPVMRLGLVVGGLFGEYATEAYLEVLPAAHDDRLRTGSRAIFYVGSRAGYKRVTTSIITNLIYRQAN